MNPKNTKWYAKFQKAVDTINIEPQIKVYLLSASEEIDQKTVTFQEALEIVPKYGWGTLIGINNNLALYYDECGERGAVIRKKKI